MRPRSLCFLLLACALAGSAAPAPAAPPHVDQDGDRVFEDLEARVLAVPADRLVAVVVKLRDDASATRVRRIEDSVASLESRRRFSIVDAFAGTIEAGRVDELADDPAVAHVELDAPVHAFNATAQSSFGVSAARVAVPGLDGNADGAATYSKGDLVTAVIDSGIHDAHESLDGGKVLAFQDFTDGSHTDVDLPSDDNGHGTHVAGTIAGDGSGSVADSRGVAPGSALVGLKVLDASGSGSTSNVIAAIQWAATNKSTYGIEAVNMSLGSDGCSNGRDTEAAAVDAAVAAGLVVVVAAGNEGPGRCTIGSPGAVESAITVGAMADTGAGGFSMAAFSSRGRTADGRIKPDLVAPGVGITSARANTVSDYRALSGTSMASPFVAGVALLMRDHDSTLTPAAIKTALRSTAVDWGRGGDAKTAGTTGADIDHGAGRLDAHAALRFVGAAVGADPSVPTHQLAEGSLGATGAVVTYHLTPTSATHPVAVTLTVAGDDRDADGRSDPAESQGCHAVDFDAELFGANGARVAKAETCQRSDSLTAPAGAAAVYILKVQSYAGAGEFFLDISGATAVAQSAAPAGGTPTISGRATDGATLTVSPGSWTGEGPMTFTHQWQRCSAAGSDCADIVGATGTSRPLGSGDIGTTHRVVTRATNSAGTATATSAATAAIAPALPSANASPTITGAAQVGSTLTGSAGAWSGTAPVVLSRRWLRCDAAGAGCAPIAGQVSESYVVSADDVGARIRLRVTALNAAGSVAGDSPLTNPVLGRLTSQPPAATLPAVPGDDGAATPARPVVARVRPRTAALDLRLGCATRCEVTARLTAARSLLAALGSHGQTLVSSRRSVAAGAPALRLRLNRPAVRRLRRAGVRHAKGVLAVRVVDAAGGATRSTRFVRVPLGRPAR